MFGGFQRALKLLLARVEMQDALGAVVVFDAGIRAQLLQHAAAVSAQVDDLFDVVAGARWRAFTQKPQAPGPLARISPQPEQQRRIFFGQPFQDFERCRRIGPGFSMANRDLPAIGMAGFSRRAGLAVNDCDLIAELRKIPSRADAKQAAAKDKNAHLRAF